MMEARALLGVGLMVLVAGMNAVDAVLVRFLADDIHPFFMGFTRAAFGLLAMLPWILHRPGMLMTRRHWLHGLRAALKLGSLVALFAALAGAPLATVTAIGFASPLFVTVGAWFVLREAPQAIRIAAVVLGFIGVVVLLKPGGGT
ncbi:DMT family transporter [Salipiger mucosus]|uniref:Putative permease component of ABC transporter n=1 Tax=Salipiger mucosus DSM 16094 TaxID=1123237 RepID=S9QGM2_9RHOB|nr:DMT family transporter [Salipiger mucosus]EPX78748.1 putative permease component of ABC transporter [Salipiger mucosus DSM 16094]